MKDYKKRKILRTTCRLMTLYYAKMRLKSAPQNLNFITTKAISKSYTLDCSYKCPYIFPHSYT